jgi:hypothetical protein
MKKRLFLIGLFISLAPVLLFGNSSHSSQAAPDLQLTPFPTPTAGPDGRIIYVVQSGDSLWRIAAVSGLTMEEIRKLNNLGVNDVIKPGDELLLGLGGPASIAPTQAFRLTPTSDLPTPTPGTGLGTICILLFEDVNGDALRQEEELSLPGGAISITDRFGSVSLTADTPSGGISENLFPEPEELGFTCFEELEQGEYNVTVAIPDGYNDTTVLSYVVLLEADQEVLLDFGAQPNTETVAKAPIPEGEGNSPILGAVGAFLLVVGIGLGIYTFLLKNR